MTMRMPSRSDSSRKSEMPHPLWQFLLVDLVGNLGHDDRDLLALLAGLDLGPCAHEDRAAPGGVGLHEPAATDDEPAGRKVGSGDQPNELLDFLASGED